MTAIQEAVEWKLRLQEAKLNEAERREYQAWLLAPGNAEEMAHIHYMDVLIERVFRKEDSARSLPGNVINFDQYAPVARVRAPEQPNQRSRRRFLSAKKVGIGIAVAASVALATVAPRLTDNSEAPEQVIATQLGAWEQQLLADGTVVYVAPATELRFEYQEHMRSVTLLRGEAFFEVAKDPDRPFLVDTALGSVRAVGTEFSTAYRGNSVVVTVAEGKVAVAPDRARKSLQPIIPLIANQQVVLSRSTVGPVTTVNADRELKWIRNWYSYDDEKVCEIVQQLNRRNVIEVAVEDVRVCKLFLNSLTFKPSEPEDFVAQVNRWYKAAGKGVALRLEQP